MARFGESFLAALTRPSYGEGLFTVGQQAAATPGRMRQQELMQGLQQEITAARMAGDATLLKAASEKAAKAGQQELANSLSQEAVNASKLAAQKAKLSQFNTAVQAIPDLVTEEGRRQFFVLGTQAGLPPEEIAQRYKNRVGEAYTLKPGEQRMLGGRVLAEIPKEPPQETFSTSPPALWKDASGNVVLKTISGNRGTVIEAGSNKVVTQADLAGLTRVKEPSVSVSVAGEDKIAATAAEQILTDVGEKIQAEGEALNNIRLVQEAYDNLERGGEQALTGIFASGTDTVRRAGLAFMNILGVSESDPIYRDMNDATTSVAKANVLTQEFVKARLAATKGAISNREFETFIASVPSLVQTADGYKEILKFMDRTAKLSLVKAAEYRNLRAGLAEKDGTKLSDINNFENNWNKFSGQFPILEMRPDNYQQVWNAYKEGRLNDISLVRIVDNKPVRYSYMDIIREGKKNGKDPYITIKRFLKADDSAYLEVYNGK